MWGPAEILVTFTLGSVPGEYLSTLQTNSTRWFPCPCTFLVVPHHSRYILGSGERDRETSLGSPLHQPGSMTLHLTLYRCVKVS